MQSNLAARLQTDTERAQASRSHTYTRSTNRLGRVEAANNRFQNGVAALLTVSAQQHRLRTPKACRCWNHLIPLLFPSLSLSLSPPPSSSLILAHPLSAYFFFFFFRPFPRPFSSSLNSLLRNVPSSWCGGSSRIYRLSPCPGLRIYFPLGQPSSHKSCLFLWKC